MGLGILLANLRISATDISLEQSYASASFMCQQRGKNDFHVAAGYQVLERTREKMCSRLFYHHYQTLACATLCMGRDAQAFQPLNFQK